MKIRLNDLTETLTGGAAVSIAVALVWLLGQCAEPYMQWIPAVAALEDHAWYSVAAPATDGFGRGFYVGCLAIMCVVFVGLVAVLAYAMLCHIRELGRAVLRRDSAETN